MEYISDALGFRTAATNLPKHVIDAPEAAVAVEAAPVAEVKAAAVAQPVQPIVYNQPIITPKVSYSYLPYATNYGYHQPQFTYVNYQPQQQVVAPVATAYAAAAPLPVVSQAVVAEPVDAVPAESVNQEVLAKAVPAVPSQYHAQDEDGQYNYGYSGPNSAKEEVRSADGSVKGSYSYVDGNGLVQSVNYVSDALGFRASGTNFPAGQPVPALQAQAAYSYVPYASNYLYSY